MREILVIAELTLREAYRRLIVWLGLGLGALFVAVYGVGFHFIYRDIVRFSRGSDVFSDVGFNFTIVTAFYVVSFLGVILAVLLSAGTLSGEIGSHTIQSLAARPLRRRSLVLGKWLGLSAMIAAYIVLLVAGVVGATWVVSRYVPPNVVAVAGLLVLQALVMLSLSVLGSTRLPTMGNGVVGLMFYGLAVVGGWIEQIGAFAQNRSATNIGIISSLVVPSEAMWKMAAHRAQPSIIHNLGGGPFAVLSPPSTAMLVYAFVYVVVAVWLAVRSFDTRDL